MSLFQTDSELVKWLKDNRISAATKEKLCGNSIMTLYDLKLLTEPDIAEFGLNIGDRNRLKDALKKLKK